jgi:hypothetical protein
MLNRRALACSSALIIAACGSEPQTLPGPMGTLAQAIRAGVGEDGEVFLGAELLVTETDGTAVPCGIGDVEFTVEVSRNGVDGPYQRIDEATVHRACSSPSQGQLALVLDNSQSLDDEMDIIKAAALSVSDRVIDRGGEVSLTRVSTNAAILSELSEDRESVRAAIDGMWVSNGWTSLYDGVRMGNETLGRAAQSAEVQAYADAGGFCDLGDSRGIVVFTDSEENNSSHQMHRTDEYPGDGINTTLGDLLGLSVGATTTPIYTVGLGPRADHAALAELAASTGGRHVALNDTGDIESVLSMLAEYGQSTHRICTQLPDHICGSLDVRVQHRYLDGATEVTGSTIRHLELPCPVRAQGRVATLRLTLDASDMSSETVFRLIAQTINWVSPVDAPRVLFVRDDAHHDEFSHDTSKLYDTLVAGGYVAEFIDESPDGIGAADLAGFDVVWFSNPGYPMDDIKSFSALRQFSKDGGGVVLQGDDMTASMGAAFSMTPLTQLEYVDNGTSYCGRNVDNGRGGAYRVSLGADSHPILAGLEGQSFLYGDDIDTARVMTGSSDGTSEVLAWATLDGSEGCAQKPVIVAFTPNP